MGKQRQDGSEDARGSPRSADRAAYALALGKIIELFRDQAGLKRQELAAMTGTSLATISRLERGRGIPNALLMAEVAQSLGTSPNAIQHLIESAVHRAEEMLRALRSTSVGASIVAGGLAGLAAGKRERWSSLLSAAYFSGLIAIAVSSVISEQHDTRRLTSGRLPAGERRRRASQ